MVSGLLFASMLMTTPAEYRILFIGNSLTSMNNVPALVGSLLTSGGYEATTQLISCAHLDDASGNPSALQTIRTGGWTHVVLQGAMISMSHKYEYSQEAAINLTKVVIAAGAKPILFAEWPRRGIDESDYIYEHYQMIQKGAGGGKISPVCYVWDATFSDKQSIAFWSADGNHAMPVGSFVAACTLAYSIAGPSSNFTFRPSYVTDADADRFMKAASKIVKERKG